LPPRRPGLLGLNQVGPGRGNVAPPYEALPNLGKVDRRRLRLDRVLRLLQQHTVPPRGRRIALPVGLSLTIDIHGILHSRRRRTPRGGRDIRTRRRSSRLPSVNRLRR
ncbi:unnamed protein product, partial [Ectocarpus sp. 13 AM-2016]